MADQQALVARIEELARALKESDIDELELTEQGTRIVIRRRLAPPPAAVAPGAPVASANGAQPQPLAAAPPPPPAAPPDPTVAILAPLTGVFYTAASPASPPYVQAGGTVQPGQIVCIVEAMKVFNEIKSEIGGTVVRIAAEPGQLVHKGEPLIRVRPA